MKLQYVTCWILVLAFSSAFAQDADSTQIRPFGYRSASTIPDAELKDIYVAKISSKSLNQDQNISSNLIDANLQKLTQSLYFAYKQIQSPSIDVLWKDNMHAWLKEDQFATHQYYRALYCLYINNPAVRRTAALRFADDMSDYLGCLSLTEELRQRLPEHASLISDNWTIVNTTSVK